MFVVRNVFQAKPGKAGALADKFKAAKPIIEEEFCAPGSMRILTDVSAGFWTVVIEAQVDDLGAYLGFAQSVAKNEKLSEVMAGYMDLVDSGYREIFKVH